MEQTTQGTQHCRHCLLKPSDCNTTHHANSYIQVPGMYGVLQQCCTVLQQYKKSLCPMWLQNLDMINPTFDKPLPRMARIQFYVSNHNHALGGLSSSQQQLIYRSGVLLGLRQSMTVNIYFFPKAFPNALICSCCRCKFHAVFLVCCLLLFIFNNFFPLCCSLQNYLSFWDNKDFLESLLTLALSAKSE